MGLKTLTNFRDVVQASLGERGFSNTLLDRWINNAYQELAGMSHFEALSTTQDFVTTDGQETQALDATWVDIVGIVNTTENYRRRLIRLAFENYLKKDFHSAEAEGPPTHWAKFGNTIYLYPVPDLSTYTFTIYGYKYPTNLSAAGDTTVLLPQWDQVIEFLAIRNGFNERGEITRGQVFHNLAVDLIATRTLDEEYHDSGVSEPVWVAREAGDLGDLE